MFDDTHNKAAHVIVCGNEKGGAGKTTTAMHIIIALLYKGKRVASIDLDGRQLSLSHYISNRLRWCEHRQLDLPHPTHFKVPVASDIDSLVEKEAWEFEQLASRLASVDGDFDFVVIDTAGFHSYLMRLAHSLADTLVTPVNESFVDLDVLATFDPNSQQVLELGTYARMVEEARDQRAQLDNRMIDWVIVRNRVAQLNSHNHEKIYKAMEGLSDQIGFRMADGIGDRNIFREFFPCGLTALDIMETETLGTQPTMSHLSARREVRALIAALRLPLDEVQLREAPATSAAFDKFTEANRVLEELLQSA